MRMPGTKSTIVGSSCQGSIHTASTPQLRRIYTMATAERTSPAATQYALPYGTGRPPLRQPAGLVVAGVDPDLPPPTSDGGENFDTEASGHLVE